jgi:hypothetical protein
MRIIPAILAYATSFVLLLVVSWDVFSWFAREQTVSNYIRHCWLSWPVAITVSICVAFIIIGHFVRSRLPGQ